MMQQRKFDLSPDPEQMEALKITYPPPHSRRRAWLVEVMKFVEHDGRARS